MLFSTLQYDKKNMMIHLLIQAMTKLHDINQTFSNKTKRYICDESNNGFQ